MYYNEEELTNKIKQLLRKYKVRYRSLNISDDRVIIGIEGYRSDYPSMILKFKGLGLQLINAVYGRWAFKVK